MKKIFSLFVLVIVLHYTGLGQIAAWDFTGVGSTSLPTFAATTFNANLVTADGANNITRGATAGWSAGNNSFRTTGFKNDGIYTSNTDYFQITLSAATGYTLSLSTIDAKFAGTGTFCASPGVSNQFAYSLNGSTFTLIGSPQVIIGTPGALTQISLSEILALQNVAAGTTVTLRYYASGQTTSGGWGFNSPSSGQNGLAIGGSVVSSGGLTPPVLTADGTNNDVDHDIDITFPDNGSWRNAVTSVKIGGTALDASDYSITAGNLKLMPSTGNVLLTTSGSKAVTVIATGYSDAAVAQLINAGVATKLGMKTQPTGPVVNGGTLATQPAVFIQDQYSNTTISTANVVAAVEDGGWIIGGTLTVAASAGTATFSGLTATSLDAVSDATISFSSESLSSTTSNTFNIPAPAPTITVSATTLTGFTYTAGSGPSIEKTFTVSGLNLTNDIGIAATTNYEISTGSGASFVATNPVTLTPTSGTVATTTIYVRLKAGLSVGTYNSEVINITSTDATAKTVTCSGSVSCAPGSFPFIENFDYNVGALLTDHCWTAHSGAGTNPVTVTTTTITYPGYLSSGIGNEVSLVSASGEDDNRTFSPQTSGTIYASFLVNVTAATTTGDYFFHLGQTIIGSTFRGRIFVKKDASNNLAFGIAQSTTPVNYTAFSYALNTTYLIVLKYEILDGTSNDVTSIYINPTLNAPIPSSGWLPNTDASGTDLTEVGSVALRQGGATTTPGLILDGIRISTNWTDIVGQQPVFTGTGNWTETARWSTGVVPGSTASVIIDGAATISTAVTVSGITINGSRSLTIDNGGSLTLSGTLTNAAGASGLVIESGGSLIQSSDGVNAIVKRDFNAWSNNHGWHFISSPVSSQSISGGFTVVPADEYDFYKWSEVDNLWLNQKVGANNITTFEVGSGYLAAYKTGDTKQFSGTLNKDNVSVNNLSLSGGANYGWHLLGNPFTSALTWATGWSLTNINTTAKIWEESSASYIDIASGGIIPALNGFMVEVNTGFGGNNSLTIPTAARVHHAQSWYKSSEKPSLKLLAKDAAGQTAQESIIRFIPDATPGFDPDFDSHFLAGYAPLFYSRAGEENLSTNALPESGGSVQIPFDFYKNESDNFSIEAREINGIFGPVYLNDLKLGNSQDLTTNPVYAFSSATGDNPARFLVTFSHVGMGENQKDNVFTVYSSGDQLIVVDNSGKNQGDAVVYNMMGQAIASGKLNGNAMLKLSMNVPTGYYLVRITSSQTTQSSKVFVR